MAATTAAKWTSSQYARTRVFILSISSIHEVHIRIQRGMDINSMRLPYEYLRVEPFAVYKYISDDDGPDRGNVLMFSVW